MCGCVADARAVSLAAGEYPVASTSANERAESTKHLQTRRGETVVCVFSMQGWGNLVNTLVLVILMAAFNQYNPPYSYNSLNIVWRLSYALGLIPLIFMCIWRIWFLKVRGRHTPSTHLPR